jgi:hypothetical protein
MAAALRNFTHVGAAVSQGSRVIPVAACMLQKCISPYYAEASWVSLLFCLNALISHSKEQTCDGEQGEMSVF